jgi:hypothetical protein
MDDFGIALQNLSEFQGKIDMVSMAFGRFSRFSQDQRAEDGLRLAAHHHKRESGGRRCKDTDATW